MLIEDGRVSRRHAQVISEGDALYVEDLGSTNGTSLNDAAVTAGERTHIQSGDKISVGGYLLVLSLPGESAKTAMGLSGRTAAIAAAPTVETAAAWLEGGDLKFRLHDGTNTFGRKADNDIVLDTLVVSGRHCAFDLVGVADVFLEDLGSTNGTYVNDHMIKRRTKLNDGDVIAIGPFRIKYLQASEEPSGFGETQAMTEPADAGAQVAGGGPVELPLEPTLPRCWPHFTSALSETAIEPFIMWP